MVGGVEPKELEPENLEFKRMFTGMGWSQPQIARELGITSGAVSRYLSGEICPKRSVLRLLAEIAGDRLNLPGEEVSASRTRGPRWMTDWETEIVQLLRGFQPEKRTKAIAAIKALIDALSPPRNSQRRQPRAEGSPKQPPDPVPSSDELVEIFAGDITGGITATPSSGAGGTSEAHPHRSSASASTGGRSRKRPAPDRIGTGTADKDG